MNGLTFHNMDDKEVTRLLTVAEEALIARQKALKVTEPTEEQSRQLAIVGALLTRLRFSRVCSRFDESIVLYLCSHI
jgi:hypothetical protein